MFDQIKPFENGQTVYAFPYFDSTCFDEFIENAPTFPEFFDFFLWRYWYRNFYDYDYYQKRFLNAIWPILYPDRKHPWFSDYLEYLSNMIPDDVQQKVLSVLRINFSLLNDAALTKDLEYFSRYKHDPDYKPYFYEFQGYCNSFKTLAYMHRNYRKRYPFICTLNINDRGLDNDGIKENYHKNIEESNMNRFAEGSEGMSVTGFLLFSASPIKIQNGALEFSSETDKLTASQRKRFEKLARVYKCRIKKYDKQDIKLLNNIPTGIPDEVTVRNVGQANNILIKCTDNSYIQYDVGIDRSSKFLENYNNVSEQNNKDKRSQVLLSEPKPSIIILSHWDLDHILGVAYANESIYEDTIWIVPEITSLCKSRSKRRPISLSAQRLLKFLEIKNRKNLYIISESWAQAQIYGSSNGSNGLQIWTGKRAQTSGLISMKAKINGNEEEKKEKYYISAANNFGLIVTLTNKEKTVLLPGDCDYKVLPDNIRNQDYDYLVVPHHCSKMSSVPFNPNCQSNKQRIAIISHGANTYGHPNVAHKRDLKKHKYEIKTTAKDNDITFSL